MKYIRANFQDARLLTGTAIASKSTWGYPQEWMNLWQEDLTVTEAYIHQNNVIKVFHEHRFIGFFAWIEEGDLLILDHLWLIPGEMRKGFGRQIFEYIREMAREMNKNVFELVAEPYARHFYEKMGGKISESRESKIKGRMLDIYTFYL